ncbi:MAG: molybdenum cofactor synthesis domain-containing protein [Bacteroidota bacterium]
MTNNKELVIRSINISREKGTIKKPVESSELTKEGLKCDAHSGPWHRQVSMMSAESIRNFNEKEGRNIEFGEFAENITVEGMDLTSVDIFDRFKGEDFELEVTQIGKKCHGGGCAIYREVGKCAMPKEGIFCRVVRAGSIQPGDKIEYIPATIKGWVITLSDRVSKGIYEDKSGEKIASELENYLPKVTQRAAIERKVIPDEPQQLSELITKAKSENIDFIFTTGGTGIGSRDIAPETLTPFIDKDLPGIMEMVRVKYGKDNPNALLSRSIAGVSGKTLIYALPGSSKAVEEYLDVIVPTLMHSLFMLHDLGHHHE